MQLSPQLLAGARAVLPVLPGVATFGVITGVAMIGAGLSAWGAIAMSVIVFAGTAQLAALQLAAAGASLPVIFFAGLVINLRFALYSLSISRYVGHAPRRLRFALAYLLSDNGYAHAIARIRDRPGLAAAFASGAVAIASYSLPYRLGLLLATAAGVAAGLLADRWTRSRSPA